MSKTAHQTKRETVRIGRYLNEIVTIKDSFGNVIHKTTKPLMVELYPRDIMQLIVGSTLLSIPVSLTDEVWQLGITLPLQNAVLIIALSLLFTSLFVYYNFYRQRLSQHRTEFIKRIMLIYIISISMSFFLLYIFNKASLDPELWMISFKRSVIVAFPASMSAAVADMLK